MAKEKPSNNERYSNQKNSNNYKGNSTSSQRMTGNVGGLNPNVHGPNTPQMQMKNEADNKMNLNNPANPQTQIKDTEYVKLSSTLININQEWENYGFGGSYDGEEAYIDYSKIAVTKLNSLNETFIKLITIVPSVNSVNELMGEDAILEFIKSFRVLMRLKNILEGFTDFKWSDLSMSEQMFEDYKSKYLDLYEKIKNEKNEGAEKVSILEDVDFELELIHKDEINVSYILQLLARLQDTDDEELKQKQKDNISNILNNNPSLRSKRELIEKFINENLLQIKNSEDIEEEFEKFWDEEKEKAYKNLCHSENLDCIEVKKVVDKYIYEQRIPLKDDVAKTLKVKPKLLERKRIVPIILDKIVEFVDKFYEL